MTWEQGSAIISISISLTLIGVTIYNYLNKEKLKKNYRKMNSIIQGKRFGMIISLNQLKKQLKCFQE